MGSPEPILEVGLTGGIACGKSSVAGYMAELGAFVIDADEIVQQVTAPRGSAYDDVVRRFGTGILDAEGRIDRPALAARVFNDAGELEALNSIVHPRVHVEARRRVAECAREGRATMAVFDAALLVETGAHKDFHRLVVVTCRRETQMQRLRERGLGDAEATARIDAQAPVQAKVAVADHVIDTDCTLEETRRRTASVYAELLQATD